MLVTIHWTDGTSDADEYADTEDAIDVLRFILRHSLGSCTQSVTIS